MADTRYDVSPSATSIPMMGEAANRYDGRAKVTGEARYAADEAVAGALHAAYVMCPHTKGRIASIDTRAAEAVPGVRLVLSHENQPRLADVKTYATGGIGQATWQGFDSADVHFALQPVALVVAESIENAREAASLVDVRMARRADAVGSMFADDAPAPRDISEAIEPIIKGDVNSALARAATTVSATYTTPAQHHNPIELYHTTASWLDGSLTVQCPSQWVVGLRAALATKFELPVERVRAVAYVTGGGFGCKATVMAHTFVTAQAARMLGRPVKLYVSRHQMFSAGSFRPQSSHDIRLGADSSGRLIAIDHAQTQQTSAMDDVPLPGPEQTCRMYGYDAIRGVNALVTTDTNTPGFMRAPAEVPAYFALESAIDELSRAANVDPVDMRIRSDSANEPVEDLPWTSRSLVQCLERGREIFGWEGLRQPGTRRRDGLLVGYGMASAIYPIYTSAATADVRMGSDLSVRVSAGAQDIGGGTYNVCQQVAAATLGIPLENVRVELGDSDYAPNGVAGGSRQTGSLSGAVQDGCRKINDELVKLAFAEGGPLEGASRTNIEFRNARLYAGGRSVPLEEVVSRAPFGVLNVRGSWVPKTADPKSVRELYRRGSTKLIGFTTDEHARGSFGANFVEVTIDPMTGEIRVPRMVGVFAAGRIINAKTARSQLLGGMIWGIGSALHEATEIDHRAARFVNSDLGEYHVPVNADVQDITIEMLEETDTLINPLGAKGIGELGIVGMAAAVANAVYDASGVRVRDLPIRMENVLTRA